MDETDDEADLRYYYLIVEAGRIPAVHEASIRSDVNAEVFAGRPAGSLTIDSFGRLPDDRWLVTFRDVEDRHRSHRITRTVPWVSDEEVDDFYTDLYQPVSFTAIFGEVAELLPEEPR